MALSLQSYTAAPLTVQEKVLTMCFRSVSNELMFFINEVPDMLAGALRRDWGEDSASNFLAWLVDWFLRIGCWVLTIPYPFGDERLNRASNVAEQMADTVLRVLCWTFGVAYPYATRFTL